MRLRFALWLIVLSVLLFTGCANTDDDYADPPGSEMEHVLDNDVSEAHPGYVLHVDSPYGTWDLSAGTADLATGEAMTVNHRLRMGSATKTFTATLCLLLYEDGLIDFDQTLDEFLPELTVPHDSLITLDHLISMRSGIADYANDGDAIMEQILDDPERQFTPQELIDYALELTDPETMQPGTTWHYSNTNYILLGLICEEVSGNTYANLLKTRILDPFGLSGITVDDTPVNFAHGYFDVDEDGELDDVTTWNPTQFWSAGCLVGTARDMGRFARALFDGQILSADSMQLMQTWHTLADDIPFKYGYGCGFHTDMDLIGHNGGTPGYAAEMWYHMPSGTVVGVISNSNRTDYDHTFNVVYQVLIELGYEDEPESLPMRDWITL